MIVVCAPSTTPEQRSRIDAELTALGFPVAERELGARRILELPRAADACRCSIERLAGVERVFVGSPGVHLAAREFRPEGTTVRVGEAVFGGDRTVVIAGPCAVEGRTQLLEVARAAADAGASVLRGGAFKPRTSPYSFPGLGRRGLELLTEARAETGLPIVTEVLDTRDVEFVAAHADMLQIGSRNMHNFALLSEVGRTRRPVLLKRGMSATIDELLAAAEYVLAGGNDQVVLCERGIRTFETSSRNTLDIGAVPLLHERTHLPVVVDPSHASGRRALVRPLALAAAAAGAEGVMVEVHAHPAEALSDGDQALLPAELVTLVREIRGIDAALRPPSTARQPLETHS